MPKVVSVFLASSIVEFETERIYIGNHIQALNDHIGENGVFIKLFLCEDESKNKQSIYDRQIESCDVFIALVGEKLGKITEHELREAKDNANIKKRIIILTKKGSINLIPKDIISHFDTHVFEDSFLNLTYQLIENTVEETSQVLPESSFQFAPDKFAISLPRSNNHIDSLENAIFCNIIRGYNVLLEGMLYVLCISDEVDINTINAYLSLLTTGYEEELKRSNSILRIITKDQIFWILVNKNCASRYESFISNMTDHLNEQHYAEFYGSNNELSETFSKQLIDALLQFRDYKYIVEDHILKRENFFNHNKQIIKELVFVDDQDNESINRKEHIILNVIEFYRVKEDKTKHAEALRRIENLDYDFFIQAQERIVIEKYTDIINTIVHYIDYRIDQLNKSELSYDELINGINECSTYAQKNNCVLNPNTEFNILIACINLICAYEKVYPKTASIKAEYLERALSLYERIDNPDRTSVDYAKQFLLQLCEITYKNNDYAKTQLWADYGLKINEDKEKTDIISHSIFLVYSARVITTNNRIEAHRLYTTAEALLQSHYNQDNKALYVFIQLKYERIINVILHYQSLGGLDIEAEYEDLQNKYDKYLSEHDEYLLAKAYLQLIQAAKNNDASICKDTIQFVKENQLLEESDNRFLDIYYLLHYILLESEKETNSELFEKNTLEAIDTLQFLHEMYNGMVDKALCLQNTALAYMRIYQTNGALAKAEETYLKALELYSQLNMKVEEGNICDGLSYCYLLKKEFDKAFIYAQMAYNNNQYQSVSCYCNYVSSSFFTGRYKTALKCLKRHKESDLKNKISEDFAEMNGVGIDTKKLKLFLMVNHLL